MTLDEMGNLARDSAEDDTGRTSEREWDLARALLAVLPVIRAAESWHRVHNGLQYMLAMRDARNALVDAISTMRSRLKDGR